MRRRVDVEERDGLSQLGLAQQNMNNHTLHTICHVSSRDTGK
jgi:hypothetical protein